MYREFRPPELTDVVDSVWTNAFHGTGRVMPDGCMDMIWTGDELMVAGPDSSVHLAEGTGKTLVGVRFKPGIAPGFLGIPAHALKDSRVALTDLWDREKVNRLTEEIRNGKPGEALRRAVATAEPDGLAAEVRRRARVSGDVGAMAESLGFSERHLHRLCQAKFGYGPKILHRIIRFNHAMNLAYGGTAFAEAAQRTGYADQAHFAREVRALAGTTLTELLNPMP
jgi:AraC-like DNA-binding protein